MAEQGVDRPSTTLRGATRGVVLAGAAAMVLTGLAGCGSPGTRPVSIASARPARAPAGVASTPPPTPTTPPPSASPSTPAPPTSAPALPRGPLRCRTAALRLSYLTTLEASGKFYASYAITNIGSAACTLDGFPTAVAEFTSRGTPEPLREFRPQPGQAPPGWDPPSLIVLAARAQAEVDLSGDDWDLGLGRCVAVASLHLTMPGAHGSLVGPTPLPHLCSRYQAPHPFGVEVSAIQRTGANR